MSELASLLTTLARSADACERSWSITADGVEARVLFFFDIDTEAATRLAEAALALGAPQRLIADWTKALSGCDAIGLALRCDGASVRLYTQYWLQILRRLEKGKRGPAPLYRGFKALPEGRVRYDEYLVLPLAEPAVFWPPMAAGFRSLGLSPTGAAEVFADLTAETAIFTGTEGGGRKSWLTTVRRAQIDAAALAAWLSPLSARAQTAPIQAAAAAGAPLVHVAGGRDSAKGAFLTFYFESDPDTVLADLQPVIRAD